MLYLHSLRRPPARILQWGNTTGLYTTLEGAAVLLGLPPTPPPGRWWEGVSTHGADPHPRAVLPGGVIFVVK